MTPTERSGPRHHAEAAANTVTEPTVAPRSDEEWQARLEEILAESRRRRQARADQRAELQERRVAGKAAGHAQKLARGRR